MSPLKADGVLRRLWCGAVSSMIRHSRLMVTVVALLTLGAIFFLARLKINPDVNSLIQSDDPTLRLTRHLLGDAPLSRTLMIVLRADRPEELEAAIPTLVERLKASAKLKQVIATREDFLGPRLAWIRQSPVYALPPETLAQLRGRLVGPERREELEAGKKRIAEDPLAGKETFLRDPLGLLWIFEQAGDYAGRRFPAKLRSGTPFLIFDTAPPVAFVRASGTGDSFNLQFTRELMADLDSLLRESLGGGPVRAELAGGYVTARAQEASMRQDIKLQFITSIVGVFLLLVWFMRSWSLPAFVFLPVGLAIVWGLGYGSAILGPLTPITMSMTAIVAGLGTDYPIYLLTRYWMERRGSGRLRAILRTQLFLGRPVVGASVTTMAGFLVLGASRFSGLKQFGAVTFLGFALAVVLSQILFPVLGFWIDRLKPVRPAAAPWAVRGARWLVGRRVHRPLALSILLLGAASWIGVLRGRIPVDLDLRHTLSSEDPGQKVLESLEGSLGIAMSPVFALVDQSVPLDELRRRADALKKCGAAAHADGPQELTAPLEAVERAVRFRAETQGWVDQTLADLRSLGVRSERLERNLRSWEDLLAAPPPALEALSRPEFSALRRTMTYEEGDRRYWVTYLWPKRSLWLPKDREGWNLEVRAILGEEVQLLSVFHAPDYQAGAIRKDLGLVGGLAVAAVAILTVLCLGSLTDGLLALFPVFVATGLTLAICSLMGGTIKSMNLAAIPILMGIGCDGGIYYVACLRARDWRDPAGAIDDMGTGYWGATITTILGFGSIATSSTPGLSFLGTLVIVGMTSCFIATLYMLPGLVRGSPKAPAQTSHST
jgi:predicted exporter